MKVLPWYLVWGLNLYSTPDKSAPAGPLPQINARDHLKVFPFQANPFLVHTPTLIDVKFSM